MKIDQLNLNLIFFDNPISRFYINFLKSNSILKKVVIVSKYLIFKKFFMVNKFIKNNNFPLMFLRKKENKYFIDFVEEYFNLEKNFIKDSYTFQNIDNFDLDFINSESINSKKSMIYFNNNIHENYLYTGREIINKKLLEAKKNFFHFHPAFLPNMRGADISLRSVFYKNEIGCTFFKINEKIDKGNIFFREQKSIDRNVFKILKNLEFKDFYNFWYSFIDPSIRLSLLKKIFLDKIEISVQKFETLKKEGEYFSFLHNEEINIIYNNLKND